MLRPTPATAHSHDHRPRVLIPGAGWHIPVRDIDTLEGIAWGTGHPISYPAGEGWATTHVANLRVCAWYGGVK